MRVQHFFLLFLLLLGGILNAHETALSVVMPKIIMSGITQTIELQLVSEQDFTTTESAKINGKPVETHIKNGSVFISYDFPRKETLTITYQNIRLQKDVRPIPLWMSILPPLLAILIAFVFKEVFIALFIGILSGTSIIHFYQDGNFFIAFFKGILSVFDTYIVRSLNDSEHLSIIVFTMTIGGMVQLITKNGGMKGVVNRLSTYAKTARSGQFITWFLGICIFFDDYANTLVVGNTMRPVTDKLKISREKLAYLVDSTAAPVAAIAFVTTWIGAELSYIQDGIDTIGLNESAYSVFFNSLSYSFYPFLTLIFMLLLIWQQRDFGLMLKMETLSRNTIMKPDYETQKNTENYKKQRAFNAIIPILVLILGTIFGLFYTGWDILIWENESLSLTQRLSGIIGKADSYIALLWSSLLSLLTALIMTVAQRLMKIKETIEHIIEGYKMMLNAIMILTMAWSIALVTYDMCTANFISQSLLNISFSPFLVPFLTFILAGIVSFSTGSSWGTMAILYPLLLPTSWLLTEQAGLETAQSMQLFYNVVASVMAGSVFGDHCSPISDTTILSSMASGCDHISHIRTQMPYTLTVGFVAVFVGVIPAAFGVPSWLLFIIGVGLLFGIIRLFGKKPDCKTS